MIVRTDSVRILVTALLVYAAFWNPWLQSSMTWNFLDAAVSFVDTGRWEMAHSEFYERKDTAVVHGRLVSGEPPGMATLVMPFYMGWRLLIGPVDTVEAFQAFNSVLALMIGATASAFIAVQVAWLAGWLGAGRRGRILAALLVAFGTQNFFFGTTLFKEGPAALGAITAFRLAVGPGGIWRRAAAGLVAGFAMALAHPVGLLALLLLLLVAIREGMDRAAAFLGGCAPIAFALGAYNTWFFGLPWHTGYMFLTGLTGLGFVPPKLAILLDLLVGPRSGLFLYSPFLLTAFFVLGRCWQTDHRGEAVVTVVFVVGLWIAAASWQSQFGDRASWATGLGPRMMFEGIPIWAAFAGLYLERVKRGMLLLLAVPSVLCGYLSAQAGLIPGYDLFPYAIKTWVSGTATGILFKEALPKWLGFDTLHTVVSRPDVSAQDLFRLLPTPQGFVLIRNQFICLAFNLVVLGCLAWFLRKLWASSKEEEQRSSS